MTKEDLFTELDKVSGMGNVSVNTMRKLLNEFFSQNICVLKGKNRHEYANVLHAYAEGQEIESKGDDDCDAWRNVTAFTMKEYRIKPSEPTFEWQWLFHCTDMKFNLTADFYTDDEIREIKGMSSDSYLHKIEETKRERK